MSYLEKLEFKKILEQLKTHAISEPGKEKCMELLPMDDSNEINIALKQSEEASILYIKYGAPSFMDIKDITTSAKRAQSGAVLSIQELLNIAAILSVTDNLLEYLNRNLQQDSFLYDKKYSLIPDNEFARKIAKAFPSPEEIWDGASDELRSIRKKQMIAKNKVRSSLESYIKSPAYSKYLQDPIITIRKDRFVIPVKAEYRAEIKGLIHDTSTSGATLFIEPMNVVAANNELSVLAAEEAREIERILSSFSAEVAQRADSLILSCNTCIFFDFVFAKGKYANDIKATIPITNDKGIIQLKQARHPLIDRNKVVPIDISVGKRYSSLIITGPNTGGKTVSLKTTGLLCLMTKAGLLIPCKEESKVAIFDEIYADIGDEQSIEQSLSTFSAHMTNIVSILDNITESSLVLIDELGAGTDPVEGAALAIAIIENIRKKGSKLICTTHFSELKLYALQSPFAENASCEFDVEKLCPTYRLITGLPGKSNAFAIASRLGISDEIIEEAKTNLSKEEIKVDSLLADIEISRKQIEIEAIEAEKMKKEAQTVLASQETKAAQIQKEAEDILNQAKLKAQKLVEESERQSKHLIEQLEELRKQKDSEDFAKKLEQAKMDVKNFSNDSSEKLKVQKAQPKKNSRPIQKGDTVRLVSINKTAVVLEINKDTALLQAGIIKTKAKLSDLELIETAGVKTNVVNVPSAKLEKGSRDVSWELDIRGMTAYEAEIEIENYINSCSIAGLKTFSIIHGKGTGALRSAVQNYLKKSKLVDSFRLGTYGEGETGVTIVTLK